MARRQTSRRQFLRKGALAGVGFWAGGGVLLGEEAKKLANDKINVAAIGVGGKGDGDTRQAAKLGNLVAICDIDDNTLGKMAEEYPAAKKFNDYRKMFDEMDKGIDAVVVSTPDHNHAPASIMAMKLKKHVYCQKPLTHTVYEARQMREIAKKMGVATQMGNQGTAADGLRRAVEFVQGGGIGEVKEAHVWTNRPIWPQAPGLTKRPEPSACPPNVHWDEWLGPGSRTPLRQGLSPLRLARLLGLRHRRPGRHGLPHRQHGVHGPEAPVPHKHPGPERRDQPRDVSRLGAASRSSSRPAATCRR